MSRRSSLFGLFGFCALAAVVAGCSSSDGSDGSGDPNADPNATGGDESELRSRGTLLSSSEVASLVRSAGFPSTVVGRMVCTAKWESGFYTRAINSNRNGSVDRGLFQINSVHLGSTPDCPASSSAIFDPMTNARCARSIFREQGLNAWYGYRAHRSECDRTVAPRSPSVAENEESIATPAFEGRVVDTTLEQSAEEPAPLSDADMYGTASGPSASAGSLATEAR